MLHADGSYNILDFNKGCLIALCRISCSGIFLMACHSRNAVVQNNIHRIASIIYSVDKGVDSRMEKCGISEDCHHSSCIALCLERLLRSVSETDAGSHTYSGIHSAVRFSCCQRITANISAYHNVFSLSEAVKKPPVRAACTESRRTADQSASVKLYCFIFFTCDAGADHIGSHLSISREKIFSDTVTALLTDKFFYVRVVFLQNIYLVYFRAEFFYETCRKRICKAQF